MQRISIALSALTSHEQYRLKRASKVTKTDIQTIKLGSVVSSRPSGLQQSSDSAVQSADAGWLIVDDGC